MTDTLAFLNSTQDLLIVLAVVVVLFGGAKIPQLFKGVGQGLGEFKKGLEDSKRPTDTEEAPSK